MAVSSNSQAGRWAGRVDAGGAVGWVCTQVDLPPRQLDVLHTLRYHGTAATMQEGEAVIVTGHSLWFREFCARFAPRTAVSGPQCRPESAPLLAELGTKKLCNCGIAGCGASACGVFCGCSW
jgi:hypothetical protein